MTDTPAGLYARRADPRVASDLVQTTSGNDARQAPRPPLARRTKLTLGVALVVLAVIGGVSLFAVLRPGGQEIVVPQCSAGTGGLTVPLDPSQAAIASTIAGVAARHQLPEQAVTVAYATALQESGLENLGYGDRDSLGVFQQRPSQGWGRPDQIKDPVYATTRFFDALTKIHDYPQMPVYQAAQAVQRSADGSAYEQFAQVSGVMATAFTGAKPHQVTCWYNVSDQHGHPGYAAAARALSATFGTPGEGGVLSSAYPARSGIKIRTNQPWTVASWLVTHAAGYGIRQIRCNGYSWTAGPNATRWQRGQQSAYGSIVAR